VKLRLVVPLGLAGSLFAADPLVGTWKLNVSKSKGAGPVRGYKEWIVVYEEHEGQLVCSETGTYEDGSPVLVKFTVPNTGGTVHYLQGAPAGGASITLSPRREDSHTADWPVAIAGKVIATARDVVSSDGKTLTSTVRGNDAEGKPFEAVGVFERQTTNRSPRSTVGTITEIYDYLRVLYSSIGVPQGTNGENGTEKAARRPA
jgi:hypothetical protein